MEIIIPDQKKLDQTIAEIKADGPDKIHVLSDFDRTLTYGYLNQQKTPSLIAVLRNGMYLTPDYAPQAHALFDKYHPIEIDEKIPLAERKEAMNTWWRTHKKLLIDSGLSKKDLLKMVQDPSIRFRQGVDNFLEYLHKKDIPLVILSGSGAGEAIPFYFQNIGKDYNNIHYITNQLNWSDDGRALSIKEPVIHSLNKDEITIKNFPDIYQQVSKRKNVILLGDSLGDVHMIDGFDYDHLIKIGFLNYNIEETRSLYLENFDIIITDDGDFEAVNNLIKDLCK